MHCQIKPKDYRFSLVRMTKELKKRIEKKIDMMLDCLSHFTNLQIWITLLALEPGL